MKMLGIFALLLVGLFMTVPAFSAENTMNDSHSSMKNAAGSREISANDFIGKNIKTQNGEELGKVEDLILSRDGSIDFVVLSRGGMLGAGEKYVPVPFKTFSASANMSKFDPDSDLIANFDKSKLDNAPTFKDMDDITGGKMQWEKVCSYYGAAECTHRTM